MRRDLGLALVVLAGCALTSRSAPLDVRYFAPPSRELPAETSASPPSLRLGRVTPGALLRTRIVHRDSPVELTPYESLRWTDPPEVYVRREVVRALFDTGAFVQAIDGTEPVLDVDISGFEEVRRDHRRFGRVELTYRLHDERRVIAHGVVAAEREVAPGESIDGVVVAIGGALDDAATELARRLR